jgi:hypothetical protein
MTDTQQPDERDQVWRELLGKIVREQWVIYCRSIGDDKPSHVAPWAELSEQDKEADRQIGEALWLYFTKGKWPGIDQPAKPSQIEQPPYSDDDLHMGRHI